MRVSGVPDRMRPKSDHTTTPMLPDSFCRLVDLLSGRRPVVLSGAGCSTESGIPDYRGPDGPRRERAPISYQAFVGSAEARRRYWARSAVGWARMSRARPNAGHAALAEMEAGRICRGVITQNVDGLHQAAGSGTVVELHGSLDRVVCLECGATGSRGDVQARLLERNPRWRRWTPASPRNPGSPDASPGAHVGSAGGTGTAGDPAPDGGARREIAADGDAEVEIAPDGDAEIPEAALAEFRVPACRRCGGVLKPDVVFFGENVPAPRVERAWDLFDRADALLVAGSSLAVYSGFRFVLRAAEEDVPVGIVNLGETRGDDRARVRVHGRVGEVLPELADALLRDGSRRAGARRRGAARRAGI